MADDRSSQHGSARSGALRAATLALLALAGAGFGACSDEAGDTGERRAAGSGGNGPHTVQWLEVSSPITPAQWLASRGEARARPANDPEVLRVAGVLKLAHSRYRESERMIANRSAQLSDMLAKIGVRERATDVLDDLTRIGGELGQTEGFGAISQHYFNLRAAATSRTDALAILKTRYGPKS